MKIFNDISGFLALRPASYGFLKALKLDREVRKDGYSAYSLEIILRKIDGDVLQDLHMSFFGVIDIKLGDLGGMLGMLLDIEDVHERQLEGISYSVSEQENAAFSFLCAGFCAEVVSSA